MNDIEELLQRRLERLEAGEPLESCLAGLPAQEAELLRLAASLQALQPPVRDSRQVIRQRAAVVQAALAPPRQSRGSTPPRGRQATPKREGRAWLWPALSLAGLLFILVVGSLVLTRATDRPELTPGTSVAQEAPAVQGTPAGSPSPTLAEQTAIPDQATSVEPAVPATTPPTTTGELEPADGFLDIEGALQVIDSDVCQEAHQTWSELQTLRQQGTDVGELETAVQELVAELENCPQLATP